MNIQHFQSKISVYVDQYELPEHIRDALYEMAMDDYYNIIDMLDGDFYYRVPLTSSDPVIVELVGLLPLEVIKEDKFGISFYQ